MRKKSAKQRAEEVVDRQREGRGLSVASLPVPPSPSIRELGTLGPEAMNENGLGMRSDEWNKDPRCG